MTSVKFSTSPYGAFGLRLLGSLLLAWGMVGMSELSAQCTFNAPYMQTFDNNSTPACWSNSGAWSFADISTSGFPSPSAPGIDDHTGNGGYFAWMDASTAQLGTLISPAIRDSGIGNLGLSFWYYIHHSNFSPPANTLAIDIHDGSNWQMSVATISTNSPYWRYHTLDLSSYNINDSLKVRFRGITSNFSQDILLDDVFVGEFPTCDPPQSVLIDTVTGNSANFDIIGSTSNLWQYEYGPAGFTLGSGTRGTTTANQLNFQGLQPLTDYELFVRQICGVGDTSVWYKRAFRTACGVDMAPLTESFDVNGAPLCWSNYLLSGSRNYSFTTLRDHTGNGGYAVWYRPQGTMALETPLIDISALSQPSLVFWLQLKDPFLGMPGESLIHLKVEISENTIDWSPLDSFSVMDFNWQKKILDLQNQSSSDTLAFRFLAEIIPGSQGNALPRLYFDDISVQELPTCPLPVDSLHFTGVTDDSAMVHSQGNSATQIQYGLFGFQHGSGNFANLSGGTAQLSNLQPGSFYTVYFRDSCNGGWGQWSLPYYFKTKCAAVQSVPYAESFNAMPNNSQDFSLACWSSYGTGNTPWVSGGSLSPFTGPAGAMDGNYAYIEGDSGAQGDISYLESPWIDMSDASFPFISFYGFMYGSGIGDLCLEVYDGSTWDTIPNFPCISGQHPASHTAPWFSRVLGLTGYRDTIKIRFKAVRGSNSFSDIAIDNIRLFDTCIVSSPSASFNFNADSITSQGQYISFSSTSSSTVEYYWDFDDGSQDTGQTVQHLFRANGSYSVQHNVVSACKEEDSVSEAVVISDIGLPEGLAPGAGISVFPNPARELLNVVLPAGLPPGFLKLENASGQVVLQREARQNELEIDISHLPKGFYILSVQCGSRSLASEVLIH